MTEIAMEIENDRSLKLHQTWQVGLSFFTLSSALTAPTTNEGHPIHQSVSGWGSSERREDGGEK
jgi:hypothetical protein